MESKMSGDHDPPISSVADSVIIAVTLALRATINVVWFLHSVFFSQCWQTVIQLNVTFSIAFSNGHWVMHKQQSPESLIETTTEKNIKRQKCDRLPDVSKQNGQAAEHCVSGSVSNYPSPQRVKTRQSNHREASVCQQINRRQQTESVLHNYSDWWRPSAPPFIVPVNPPSSGSPFDYVGAWSSECAEHMIG